MLALESRYFIDLTGEGDIGDRIESVVWQPLSYEDDIYSPPLGLYALNSGALAIDDGWLEPGYKTKQSLILYSNGSLWSVPRGAKVIGVLAPEYSIPVRIDEELIDSDRAYKVVMVTGEGSRASYTIERFNLTGESFGRAERLSPSEVLTLEAYYRLDFNDDGIISERDSATFSISKTSDLLEEGMELENPEVRLVGMNLELMSDSVF